MDISFVTRQSFEHKKPQTNIIAKNEARIEQLRTVDSNRNRSQTPKIMEVIIVMNCHQIVNIICSIFLFHIPDLWAIVIFSVISRAVSTNKR